MIPEGPIFARLRNEVLDFYVPGPYAGKPSHTSISRWLSNGTFIPKISGKKILIQAADKDICPVAFGEIESLFNNCFEHMLELIRFHEAPRFRSDGWSVTTTYYLGFFAAEALLKLLGRSIIYLQTEDIKNTLGGMCSGGVFGFRKVGSVSGTQAEYELKPIKKRLHEAVWNELLIGLDSHLHNKDLATNTDEVLFYSALLKNTHASWTGSVHDWPTQIRNRANYRAGFAYRLVEKMHIAKTGKLLADWDNEPLNIIKVLESAAKSDVGSSDSDFCNDVKFLHHFSLAVFFLARSLYWQLVTRNNLDKRRELARKNFRIEMSMNCVPLGRALDFA